MSKTNTKRAYRAPRLTVHGSIESITQGASDGNSLDVAFQAGTPVSELTFS